MPSGGPGHVVTGDHPGDVVWDGEGWHVEDLTDEQLDALRWAVDGERVRRHRDTFVIGDRIVVNDRIEPKKLAGATGTVVAIRTKTIQVLLDDPVRVAPSHRRCDGSCDFPVLTLHAE